MLQLAATTCEKIFNHCLNTILAKDDYAIHRSMRTCDSMHHILKTKYCIQLA